MAGIYPPFFGCMDDNDIDNDDIDNVDNVDDNDDNDDLLAARAR